MPRTGKIIQKPDMTDKGLVIRHWIKDKPKKGFDRNEWCARRSAETGLTVPQVERIVGEFEGDILAAAHIEIRSDANKIAAYVGLTLAKTLQVVKAGLDAEEVMLVRDGHGNLMYDDAGNPVERRRALWGVRMKAVEHALSVLDFKPPPPPQKVDVSVSGVVHQVVDVRTMTDEELEQAALVAVRAYESARAVRRIGAASPEGPGGEDQHRDDAPALPEGPVVLGHRVYEDEGRAGPAEPVQTLPEG